MNLNLFENLKKNIESNVNVKNFMKELSDFLNNKISSKTENKDNNLNKETKIETNVSNISKDSEITLDERDNKISNHRKEGHLYLVTEDRNGKVYLWDFTDKPKNEFEEIDLPAELLKVAKEGAMLQYKNGKYELYSENGYDMLFNEENK